MRSPRPWRPRRRRLAYAHGSAFTTEPLEAYAAEVAGLLPVDDPAIYPVSGGSEAIETALKLARAYHLARGERGPLDRHRPVGELPRQHPRRARPVRPAAAPPAVRELARPVPARLGAPTRTGTATRAPAPWPSGAELAAELDQTIEAAGPGSVAAFVAEPIVGATLAAAVPPDDYWPSIAEVCRRHGVLLIADEVMTGFGRTGRWFGLDHWGVRPDLLVAAKGATSGYWPFGFVAASGDVHATVTAPGAGFTHGFTYSHAPVGAAVAREVLRILRDEDLVDGERGEGRPPRDDARGAPWRAPDRRRDPRPRSDGRHRARRRPGRPPSRSLARPASPRPSWPLPGIAGCSSTRGPATPTASTATRSCSGRRSCHRR